MSSDLAARASVAKRRRSTGQANPRIRYEIEGLRFFAVFLVVVYHVWLGRVSGGVDIFLLISAFLMTGQFTRKIERGDSLNLPKHWLHLVKRLLPQAALVIGTTSVLCWLLVSQYKWQGYIQEGWSSLFYFENWTLANNAVDYYASHSDASPFQHFWSLSMQGQVFLIWPCIFLAVAFVSRRTRLRAKSLLVAIFSTVFVVSLAYSIWQTDTNQAHAYFDLGTRLWEFSLGSLMALALPYLKLPRPLRLIMGWVGLILIISCGIVLDVDRQFPGYLALWPLLAAAMVIIAADTRNDVHPKRANLMPWLPGRGVGVDRLLAARPLVFMGGNSYGLYLWHWPMLVLMLGVYNLDTVSFKRGLVMIAAAVVLAIITTQLVEKPARKIPWVEAKWYRSGLVVVMALLLAAVPLGAWQANVKAKVSQAAHASQEDHPGAAALVPGFNYTGAQNALVVPAPAELPKEFAGLPSKCTGKWAPTDKSQASVCQQKDPAGQVRKTVVILGDSHAEQWMPALEQTAQEQNWRLVALLKGACPYSTSSSGFAADCVQFNQKSTKYVESVHPDAVFIVGTANAPSSNKETLVNGFEQTVTALSAAHIPVLAIRDNPRFDFNIAQCAIDKGAAASECNPARADVMAGQVPFASIKNPPNNVFFLDMSDYICNQEECPAVVGNTYVYIDDNHLTKTYSATMGPMLTAQIGKVTGWFPAQ